MDQRPPTSDKLITPDRARRDLGWVLHHTPIVRDHAQDGARWIGRGCMHALQVEHVHTTDAIQEELLQPALKQRRSGRYFEALLVALVNADQRLELLAHDLQVRDDQRTIGAFDLLVRSDETAAVTHLELAFKQYLYRGGDSEKPKHWLGPRGRDRLDRKTRHMQEHQLQLGTTQAGSAALQALGISAVRPHALMAGRLFIHRDEFRVGQLPHLPSICSDTPELGWWCTENELDALIDSDSSWRALPPNYAIAPLNADDCAVLSVPDWPEVQQRVAESQPSLVAEVCDGVEVSRGWVVRHDP